MFLLNCKLFISGGGEYNQIWSWKIRNVVCYILCLHGVGSVYVPQHLTYPLQTKLWLCELSVSIWNINSRLFWSCACLYHSPTQDITHSSTTPTHGTDTQLIHARQATLLFSFKNSKKPICSGRLSSYNNHLLPSIACSVCIIFWALLTGFTITKSIRYFLNTI